MNRRSKTSFDAIDRRILRHLQEDGRLTNAELAERVGLSPSPCLRRVRQLELGGVLKRYVALIDPERVGLDITAFVRVALERQDATALNAFEAAIVDWPEVLECYLMTGEADYQLRVMSRTLADYETFMRDRLARAPGVAKIQSSLAFRPVLSRTQLPLD